jgi:predicted transposase YbfD/YdcC
MAESEPTPAARDIARIFSEIPDSRVVGRCRHKLGDILTIALCTTLCGSSEFTEMEAWGMLNEGWLCKFLELPNGIPSHDTFLAVFCALDPEDFLDAFLLWVGGVRERTGEGVVALDGKACRGTKGAPGEMLTMVGAFASAQGISLGQLQVEGKSNEITAVPRLLDTLDIAGCTVTADAMGCQKEIVAKCIEKGAGYVIALKGNQGTLLSYVSTYLDGLIDGGFEPGHTSEDRRRGRVERRSCWAFGDDLADWLEGHAQWEGLRSVVAVELEREEKGATTVERRYFITSLAPDAQKLAGAVRAHWSIENSLHWVLDVVFGEDASRARTGNAAANLSTTRRLAQNLIKITDAGRYKKWTIKKRKLAASQDRAYLARLLGIDFDA